MAKLKRKIFIVDKTLQYKLSAVIVFYLLVILGVVGISLFLPLFQSLNDPDLDQLQKGLIAETVLFIHLRFWPAFIFISAILVIHSIFVFHRIVGPLYRFRMFYKSMSEGDLSGKVKIRKHDYLHTDERLLNDTIEGLRTKVEHINTEYNLLRGDLNELNSLDFAGVNPEIVERIGMALERSDNLKQALKAFKCSS